MKTALILGFLIVGLNTAAQAQVTNVPGKQYREYEANLTASNGESKGLILQVNTELRVDTYGDPEIPSHGFYNYSVTGSIVEGSQTCAFEALLTQGKLKLETDAEIMKSLRDRSAQIKLCSGLILELASVRTLLVDASLMVGLKTPGLEKRIGTGTITSNGLKTIPEPSYDDYEIWLH